MEDPPPSATWHPALRPETMDDASLYSPDFNGPRQETLSWDDVTARTPARSRAPTHSFRETQEAIPTRIEEESSLAPPASSHHIKQMKEDVHESVSGQSSSSKVPELVIDSVVSPAENEKESGSPINLAATPNQQDTEPRVAPSVLEKEKDVIEQPVIHEPSNTQFFEDTTAGDLWLQESTEPEPTQAKDLLIDGDEIEPELSSTHSQDVENHSIESHAESIPQYCEPESPLELFGTNRQNSDDIDEAWGTIKTVSYTNSFPPVPTSSLPEAPPQPLAHFQAAAVLQEDDENLPSFSNEQADVVEDPYSANPAAPGSTEAQYQEPTSPTDDEARFEEGLPLVPSQPTDWDLPTDKDFEPDKDSFDFGGGEATDDFFSNAGKSDFQQALLLEPLERKSTAQVLHTMQYKQQDEPITESVENINSTEPAAITSETRTGQNATETLSSGAVDFAAAWGDLDDDLLDDTVDPTSFFGDDADDFLLDDADSAATPEVHAASTSKALAQAAPSYVPQGFNMNAYNRSQSPFQTEPARPAIQPRAESFVDKSKGGYASPYDAPMDLSRPRRAPAPRTPQVVTSRGPTAPPPPRRTDSTQSGYAPSVPSPTAIPQNQSPYSAYNAIPAAATPPLAAAQTSNLSASGFFEELPITAKARPSSAANRFMPPVTPLQQPGPPAPQAHPLSRSVTAPYSQPPPQQQFNRGASSYQQMPPYQTTTVPDQQIPPPRPSAPPTNPYGLVAPARSMPFEGSDGSLPAPIAPDSALGTAGYPPFQAQQQAQPASSAGGRYSPSPAQQPGQQTHQTQSSRTVPPNPYANPGAAASIARPPSVPTQTAPPKPSPLRSASANQYRPGEQAVDAPPVIPRPSSAARRPSLLKNAVSLDELPSPGILSYHSSSGPNVHGHSHDSLHGMAAPAREIRPSYDSSRQLSHLPPHQEVVTPGLEPPLPPSKPAVFVPPRTIESYSASQQAILTSANRVRASSLLGQDNFLLPNNETAQDPLQRWQGAPIFRFSIGGAVVISFPGRIPRYNANSRIPVIKSNPGEVRIHNAKILPANQRLTTFPGPLRNKSKKKDVLLWLQNSIASFLQEHQDSAGQSLLGDEQKRHEEKIMLWKVLAILVEHDGLIDGNQKALDAVRTVLSPELSINKSEETITQPLLPAITSPDVNFKPSAVGSSAIDSIRQFLLTGEREKAIWHAVDQKLWGHAMLIASTMPRELWKQVAHEFVRNEVKPAARNTESLAALYDVFAGNLEESVDELVPPSARAGLKFMNKNSTSGIASSGLDGLNRWRETLNLILSNRTVEDAKAIVAMGRLLASYGRFEAAHICYIFARLPGLFGGPDDAQAAIVLLGVDHRQAPLDYAKDIDNILLTEVFEFANAVLPATPSQAFALPHLQAFKLHHAEMLVDFGMKDEAQQYCDAITTALKPTTNRSPYYHPRLVTAVDDLGLRLRQTGKDGNSSWISKPNVGKVSSFLSNAISGFVAGDDNADAAAAKADLQGPFARINGDTPEMISRTNSPAMGAYGQFGASQSFNATNSTIPIVNNSKYAPGAAIAGSGSLAGTPPQFNNNHGYDLLPQAPVNPYSAHPAQRQQSPDLSSRAFSPPKPSRYSPGPTPQLLSQQSMPVLHAENHFSPAPSDASGSRPGSGYDSRWPLSGLGLEPRSHSYQASSPLANRYSPGPRSSSFEPSGTAYAPPSAGYAPRSYAPSPALEAVPLTRSESYQPTAPDEEDYPLGNAYNPYENGYNAGPEADNIQEDAIPETKTEEPTAVPTIDEPPSYGYQPPSSSYEPPSYEPYNPSEPSSPQSPRKKKSFMDDEDDYPSQPPPSKSTTKSKSAADAAAEDAFRRAAEADAKKDEQPKSGGGWFGGFFGKGKEAKPTEPKAHKVHLGDDNAFVYDEALKKWVNKKAGAEAVGPSAPTPPPPKGPPSRTVSAGNGPPAGMPPTSNPNGTSSPGLGTPPPSGPSSGLGPPSGLPAGLAPPSRPGTGMSGVSNASSVDDLIGPAQSRKGGTIKKGKKGRGYVDVLANK